MVQFGLYFQGVGSSQLLQQKVLMSTVQVPILICGPVAFVYATSTHDKMFRAQGRQYIHLLSGKRGQFESNFDLIH